jgi:hyperosmotically inducible periplasmic protein
MPGALDLTWNQYGNDWKKKEKKMKTRMLLAIGSAVILSGLTLAKTGADISPRAIDRIQKEVRHELVMLPFLGVFDNLAYKLNGSEVTLVGQVTWPSLKSDAANAVKSIEGVERVDNRIEVLPVSPFDNTLRLHLFRAIYGFGQLQKYALGVNKPIRIIVKNGHVTLEGLVDNTVDRDIVEIQAKGVANAFSVKNNLQVAK